MVIDAKCPIWNESKFDDYHMSCNFVCLFFINWKSLVIFVILNGLIKIIPPVDLYLISSSSNLKFPTWFFKNQVQINRGIDWPNYISLLTFDYGTINEKIRVNIVVMPSKGMSGHIDGSKKKVISLKFQNQKEYLVQVVAWLYTSYCFILWSSVVEHLPAATMLVAKQILSSAAFIRQKSDYWTLQSTK